MRRLRERWVVVGAMLVILGAAEFGVRSIGSSLPEPTGLPSVESRVKATLLRDVPARLDVVLLGDSVMEGGVDPARLRSRFGLEAFNAAVPFSTPLAMERWIDVVLARTRPRLVVVGLGFDPSVTTLGDDPLRLALEREPDTGVWELLGRHSELVRRRRQLRDWSDTLRDVRALEAGTWTSRGFQRGYLDGTIRSVATVEEPASAAGGRMTRDNEEALGRLVQRLVEEGIDVVVVMEPIRCDTEACRRRLVDSPYHRQVFAVADRTGASYLDTNVERWDPGLFVDALHLTGAGVERLTDAVGRLVEDHLSDPVRGARWRPGQVDDRDGLG